MYTLLSVVFAGAAECDPGQPVGADCANTLSSFTDIFVRILSTLIPIGGIILFVMLVLGGFAFITSGADPRKVEGAKSTLTYAIAGIVVLACAFLIIQIIANFTGVQTILNFQVYNPG